MRYLRSFAFVAGASCTAAAALAGEPGQLATGSTVRALVAGEIVTGSLLALDENALTLRVLDSVDPKVLRRADIAALEVRTLHRSRGRTVLGAAGVGAAVGLAWGLRLAAGDRDGFFSGAYGVLGAFGAVNGALGGAFWGLFLPAGERWKSVPLDRIHLGVAALPRGGRGVQASLVLRF